MQNEGSSGEDRPRTTTVPRATYRFQFHAGFKLQDALPLVPYLHQLGISHVYASPLLQAAPGSMHGYDVCDARRVNPELGTEADLAEFVRTLREHGMGLVLDIVPNHMGIGRPENRWWWDVLAHGPDSPFARYFDIDWNPPDPSLRGKVLVPMLGDEYERVLERGELQLESKETTRSKQTSTDEDEDENERMSPGKTVILRYFDHGFPIAPGTVQTGSRSLDDTVRTINTDRAMLHAVIEKQHYRLAFWRRGDQELNYRRFFTITTLAGLRVEDEQVFQDSHARVLDWYRRGFLDGLRIDHPDGLRDPTAYLHRLRAAAPDAWIVVEKILEGHEPLPSDWPVSGTTGYDFTNQVNGLFVDPAGERALTEFYAGFTGEPVDYAAALLDRKRMVLRELLAAEVHRLTRLLSIIARKHGLRADEDELRQVIVEFAARLPVYRTYVRPEDASVRDDDRALIETTLDAVRRQLPDLPSDVPSLLQDLLLLRLRGEAEADFVLRLQQLTGPAMAKGAEDTAFYSYNRLVSLNEVGGDPGRFGLTPQAFHEICRDRQAHWPDTMLATSTHDTKRSEDVRVRINLLSEIPDAWSEAVRRWSALNEKHRRNNLPDRNIEYLFYQTLVGAWPLSADRAVAYMEKASCEARQHTNWTQRNPAYDNALRDFVSATLRDSDFTADLEQFIEPLKDAGCIQSLAQTLIKLTTPGVPDIYQGTELWDLSLVDPDNRRPVGFDTRQRLLAEAGALSANDAWRRRDEGLPKLWLIRRVLALRAQQPDLFAGSASYQPAAVRGTKADRVVAFMRGDRGITVVPRLTLGRGVDWADTTLELPPGSWKNIFTNKTVNGPHCRVDKLFDEFPVALLLKMEEETA